MENIDQLTLELLMNKSTYQKYLAQTNPQRAEEHQSFKTNLHKYSKNIMSMTQSYLANPDQIQVTIEVNEMLEQFGKTWIKYFEMKEMENPDLYKRESDEDTLFAESNMEPNLSSSPITEPTYPFLNKKLNYSMDYYNIRKR